MYWLTAVSAPSQMTGRLSNVDGRWNAIAQSVDDRTPAERGEVILEGQQLEERSYMAGGGKRKR